MGCTSAKPKKKDMTFEKLMMKLDALGFTDRKPGTVDVDSLDLSIDESHLGMHHFAAKCKNESCVNYRKTHSGACTVKQLATSRLALESSYFSQTTEKEGYESRTTTLYHATSLEVARLIATSGKMLRGKKGMFGGGIYFAESADIANHKARHRGALIEAKVTLGVSLVCMRSTRMSFSTLNKQYGCHSVKGVGCVSRPEYVVYNWSQVTVTNITIYVEGYFPNVNKPAMYWESQSTTGVTYASSRTIIDSSSWPVDYTTSKSMTQLVLSSRSSALTSGPWQSKVRTKLGLQSGSRLDFLLSEDRSSPNLLSGGIFSSRVQTSSNDSKCNDIECTKYRKVHSGFCVYRCNDIQCTKYRTVHSGLCVYKCDDIECTKYRTVHSGSCVYRCNEIRCKKYRTVHSGPCKYRDLYKLGF